MTDKQLHDEILAELRFEPELHPERIGIGVEDGVVTLSGHVDSYAQKLAAERVVRRVYSAKALVDHLEPVIPARDEVEDSELAHAAVSALAMASTVPQDSVHVVVDHGHLALDGLVDWNYERRAAEEAVQHLRGLRGVMNHIRVRDRAISGDVLGQIHGALHRSAALNGCDINVQVAEGTVLLRGTVSSLLARDAAEQAAWRAPGVTAVCNEISISD